MEVINEKLCEHQKDMANIKTRSDAYLKNPWAFTIWDITKKMFEVIFWLGVWFIIAQCSCDGCMING